MLVLSFGCKFKNDLTNTLCRLHGSLLDLERIDVGFHFKCCRLILLSTLYIMLSIVLSFLMGVGQCIGKLTGPKGNFILLTKLIRYCYSAMDACTVDMRWQPYSLIHISGGYYFIL